MQSRAEKWLLRLYVAGSRGVSAQAQANLERICREHVKTDYRIDVIDVLRHPAIAREHDVVAVPMVVRESPVPIRKVVGDLSNAERALFALRLGAFDV
jgi:circadian clock protein KaiB